MAVTTTSEGACCCSPGDTCTLLVTGGAGFIGELAASLPTVAAGPCCHVGPTPRPAQFDGLEDLAADLLVLIDALECSALKEEL